MNNADLRIPEPARARVLILARRAHHLARDGALPALADVVDVMTAADDYSLLGIPGHCTDCRNRRTTAGARLVQRAIRDGQQLAQEDAYRRRNHD